MARRLIIDDRTGVLYEDFTGRRISSLNEFFSAQAGATETVEVFSVAVNPQTRAVTGNTILTANVSLDLGVPRAKPTGGKITLTYGSDTSGELPVETLTADTIGSALNRLDAMETAGGCDVWRAGDDDSELSFYIRLHDNGAPGTNPSFDCDGSTPPAIGEVTVVKTGSSSERALWLVNIAEKPVASIAESAWSTVTSGSFGGLTASLALNGAGLLAHLSKENPGELTLTVKNSTSVLYRGTVEALPSVDPNDLNGSSIHAIFPQIVTSGSDPTVNEDTDDGYGVGTLWINSSTPSAFLLMANGAGAANWDELTETATGQLLLTGGAMTGAITTNSTFDGVDVATRDAILTSTTTTANAALPKAGGAMTGAITTNSTFDGVDVATRDGVLSSTVTTANAALPKAGGAMTGAITTNSTFDGVDIATRDAILTSTTTTAGAALPKAGGTMTGGLTCEAGADMDGQKITSVDDGTALRDAVAFQQIRTAKNDNTTTAYTLVLADARKEIRINNASTHTLTVPKSVFIAGDVVTLFRKGSGGVTIAPVDGDVTINSVGTRRKLANQYSAATLICVTGGATPEFDLIGDLKS
tara:strand:- start:7881 stop:9641 length:1761 start_codon:yes stop_codon:yes gene_type:complete